MTSPYFAIVEAMGGSTISVNIEFIGTKGEIISYVYR